MYGNNGSITNSKWFDIEKNGIISLIIQREKLEVVRDKEYEERDFRQDRGIRWKYILG